MSENTYTLHCLGCRGSYPVEGKQFTEYGGQTTCYVLKHGTHAVVLDCGTGLYSAGDLLSDCTVIDVLLSHVHYDHVLGLLTLNAFPKDAEITFYGNFMEWFGECSLQSLFRKPFWPVVLEHGRCVDSPPNGAPILLTGGIEAAFYPATHEPGATVAVLSFDGRRICASFDSENAEDMPASVVSGCDILLYDGMFTSDEYKHCVGWGHSTWREGCRLAAQAKVGLLVITHHNPLHEDTYLKQCEEEAKKLYSRVVFAKAGDRWCI